MTIPRRRKTFKTVISVWCRRKCVVRSALHKVPGRTRKRSSDLMHYALKALKCGNHVKRLSKTSPSTLCWYTIGRREPCNMRSGSG